MSVDILRALAQRGLRVFDYSELAEMAQTLGLKKSYIPALAALMIKNGELVSLYKGIYALPLEFLAGGPLHSFEIAMKIAKKGAISHRSALSYYELTDQVISKIYVTVPKERGANLSTKKLYEINGVNYELIRIAPQHYWGVKTIFIGEARIRITDLERTLIDGLSRPEACGGFREVLFAYEKGISKISPTTILSYAEKTSLAVCKRLGLIFETLDVYQDIQKQIKSMPMPYTQRLDAAGPRRGKVIKHWNLLENI